MNDTARWLPGMLAISRNDGTRFRLLGQGEEPMRIDARLEQNPAEWPVQTGMVSLVPDLADVPTLTLTLLLVRLARDEPTWNPIPLEHDLGVREWVIDPPSAVRQTLYPSLTDALMAAWLRL